MDKKEFKEYQKGWYEKNKDRIIKKSKKWGKDNPEKRKEQYDKQRKEHPERIKAYKTTFRQKLRDNRCSVCGTKENLVYHHTDYLKNLGITLCEKHHKIIHKNREVKNA